jgi:AcrR family transcriptional regulator
VITPDPRPDGKVTRELVLTTALEIIDRDGADGLSMRRLARALNRDPMILYRHAPNKAALLDGVAETVLAQLTVDPADPDWAGQLRAVARDYRALALAHPHVVPLLVTRPLATPLALRPPGTLRPLEDVLALLTRAGFVGPDALHIYRALFGFVHGHILNELQELVDNPDETDDLRIPAAPQPGPRPGGVRRRRRTRTRTRHLADGTGHYRTPASRPAAAWCGWGLAKRQCKVMAALETAAHPHHTEANPEIVSRAMMMTATRFTAPKSTTLR